MNEENKTPINDLPNTPVIDAKPPKKKSIFKKNSPLYYIVIGICAAVFICSAIFLGLWIKDNINTENKRKQLQEEAGAVAPTNESDIGDVLAPDAGEAAYAKNPADNEPIVIPVFNPRDLSYMDIDLKPSIAKNSHTVGWLKINSTKVNYPVLQEPTGLFYMNHSFDKTSNSAGWIFADERCTFGPFTKNTVIYGHNRNDGSMFGSIGYMLSRNWYKNPANHIIRLNANNDETIWQVFSVYTINPEVEYLTTFFYNDSDFLAYGKKMAERSQITTAPIEIMSKDRILTLSTCFGDNKRQVVHAVLLKSLRTNPDGTKNEYVR